MSLTKLARNNFPARDSLVSDISAGDIKIANLFLQCTVLPRPFLCPSPCLCPYPYPLPCPQSPAYGLSLYCMFLYPSPFPPIFKAYKATSLLVLTRCSGIQSSRDSTSSNMSLHLFSKMFTRILIFFLSRISDPGSNYYKKEEGKKSYFFTFLLP
jgi:hypothetical protein